jgi:hypothetical protein
MNGKPKTPKGPTPSDSTFPVGLLPQTGMPSVYFSRSREIIYDALEDNPHFRLNKFGPQRLKLSRPNQHW